MSEQRVEKPTSQIISIDPYLTISPDTEAKNPLLVSFGPFPIPTLDTFPRLGHSLLQVILRIYGFFTHF